VKAKHTRTYPYSFYLPAGIIFIAIFVVPTVIAFFFSMTRWTLVDWTFIGLDNFKQFFKEPQLAMGLRNTFIYAVVTSGLKVVLGLLLAVLLTSRIRSKGFLRSVVFFPVLVSTIAVGITFLVLMHPSKGLMNKVFTFLHLHGPHWLTDPNLALLSVAIVDVWKGVGLATVIYIAGILSIPQDYFEAASVDGGGAWVRFWKIIVPLSRPASFTVIILSFIGGLRSFDLIWAMTHGGPGFRSDVIASVIFKQYQAGFFGLATAGNVILFIFVTVIIVPLFRFLQSKELES
jgi:raffinose/stachyose/melibiose transport system permease protein